MMPLKQPSFIAGGGAALLLLLACAPLLIKNEKTGGYTPIRHASLELHREVAVPPGRARVFFQQGAVLPAIDEYRPHCELTVRNLADRSQAIHADRFTIVRVRGDIIRVVASGRLQVAALEGDRLAFGGGAGDGEGRLMKIYIMRLHSDQQPQVLSLVCGGAFNLPALATRPSLQDIATALGSYATFELQ